MTQSENTDAIWKRAEIQSPCVKICVVHPEARLCIGCYRTIDEIAGWSRMAPAQRETVMSELSARAKTLQTRRGGRAARLRGEA